MNIQRRTARVSIRLLRCLILWGYDRSRHENITYGGIFYVRKRVQHSGEHGFDVVAFRIMHESGIIGRAVVRARAGFAVVGAAVGKAGLIERLHGIIVGSLERHMDRSDGIALAAVLTHTAEPSSATNA